MRQNRRSTLGPGLLGLHRAVAHKPAVHGREQLPLALAKPRVGIYCLNDANHRAGLRRGHVPEQSGEGVVFQPKKLLQPSNRRRVGRSSALLPLPYGPVRAADGPPEATLRQPAFLAGAAERAPEEVALCTGRHEGVPFAARLFTVLEHAALLARCRAPPSRIEIAYPLSQSAFTLRESARKEGGRP